MRLSRLARRASGALVAWSALASAAPARAELVYFANGRSISVKSHREAGDSLVLELRNGGEIICDRNVVVRVSPDEVPYPQPDTSSTPSDRPAEPYSKIIDAVAAEQGLSPRMVKLVKAVILAESAYQEGARSRKGAMGLMQLMPETARQYSVSNPYEPRSNIEAGIKHLKSLMERFELPLALAAYNAGEVAVRRYGGMPPYPETREYVARVLRNFER